MIDKDRVTGTFSNHNFDHQRELGDLQGQRIDDHTFGHNSKRSLVEADDLFRQLEAGNGNAVGQENAIIRPSGSKASIKQVEDVAPSSGTEDIISGNNHIPNSSTAL